DFYCDPRAGRTRHACAARRAGAFAGRRRNPGPGRRRGRESTRRDAAARSLSTTERRDRNSRPGNRRRSRPRVTRWNQGDKVMALVVGGGYAEYCLAFASHALPLPASLSMVEAAAIPETFFTVWHNVFERGRLAVGETLLVHGGSSGIGTTAI